MPAPVIDSPDTRTKSVAALALLMVLPASIAVFITIATSVCGRIATAVLTAGSWY
ncbi:MAG: hypothetical protein RR676_09300 [Acinetobacter sp.]